MGITESLQSIANYPIARILVENICEEEGLSPEGEATAEVRRSTPYLKAKAGVYRLLSTAPEVSQAGISYTLSDADKAKFSKEAQRLLALVGDEEGEGSYGYEGENF